MPDRSIGPTANPVRSVRRALALRWFDSLGARHAVWPSRLHDLRHVAVTMAFTAARDQGGVEQRGQSTTPITRDISIRVGEQPGGVSKDGTG